MTLLRILWRREPRIPRYQSPLGLWKVVLVCLGFGWLAGADRPEHLAFLMATLVGWAAPVGATRFTASLVARERAVGSLSVLAQAMGERRVIVAAVALGAVGPLLEVGLAALLLVPFADTLRGLALGASVLALQVVAAAVFGAAFALRSRGGLEQVVRRAALVPVGLYALGLLGMLAETLRPHGLPEAFRAMPPLVMPCFACGWDGPVWAVGLAGALVTMAVLLLRRATRLGVSP